MQMTETGRGQFYSSWTDLDLDADGKQLGSIYVSLSTNESAYRAFRIPLVVVRNGRGPGCLVMGGNHGDEWEGQLVASRLARELAPSDVRGVVYVMPHANLPACQAGTRLSPLDDGNLNLTWPPSPGAGPTGQIAAFIEKELFPRISHWIDLHTGGRTLIYAPKPAIHISNDPALNRRSFEALAAFGAPENLVFEVQEARSASVAAQRSGIVYIYGEFGGGSVLTQEGIDIAWNGVRRTLRFLGIVPHFPEPAETAQRHYVMSGASYGETRRLYWFAEGTGYFEPGTRLGDIVESGTVVGFVHPLDGTLAPPREVVAGTGGTVVCLRGQPLVQNGDCLGHLGLPADAEALKRRWCVVPLVH
jgi:predicted deacylase